VDHDKRLALCHYWVAFATFLVAVLLGAWQMLMRSPLPAPLDDSDAYYASVTLHGTAMAMWSPRFLPWASVMPLR
jgi:cytochrome c oxidase subunit I